MLILNTIFVSIIVLQLAKPLGQLDFDQLTGEVSPVVHHWYRLTFAKLHDIIPSDLQFTKCRDLLWQTKTHPLPDI
ncbi:hypothetical protein N7462_006562 [Penicillium macrosclerotiorum]|uniref:uncharacterized protein n=1 Tax=Penicillium macrosclerotiorum TaxID=303699 RepID=UPI0025471C3E|nr:uncharacterized protein N7462_006562 [Penicillium macrosclerotiorum]KAJ5683397.1 hypothetical protein N7462_006562 [Penicillium macrosclerotiorum]